MPCSVRTYRESGDVAPQTAQNHCLRLIITRNALVGFSVGRTCGPLNSLVAP